MADLVEDEDCTVVVEEADVDRLDVACMRVDRDDLGCAVVDIAVYSEPVDDEG